MKKPRKKLIVMVSTDKTAAIAQKIKTKQAKIAICGLGYVGTPLAALLASKGFQVTGVEIDKKKIKAINQGKAPFTEKEPGLNGLIKTAITSGRLKATDNPKAYQDSEIIIIAVETPIDKRTKKPVYRALESAIETIGRNLLKNTLVIVESTIAPKTIDNFILPKLEKSSRLRVNRDFLLAHCPERVMPGRLLFNLQNYNRIIGGYNKEAAEVAQSLYRFITKGDTDLTDTLTAEVVKTAENAYRDVQIAFANELALICEDYGINVWGVRKLVNKCPFRDVHLPGAGVGGHCLPKDSWLLVANLNAERNSKIIPLARRINDSMPNHIMELLQKGLKQIGMKMEKAHVAVLGYSYLKDSDDSRNSPTISLLKKLRGKVARIKVHDPYIQRFQGDVFPIIEGAEVIVLMTDHTQYQNLNLKKIKRPRRVVLVDGRNLFRKEEAEKLGFLYLGVGNLGG